MESLLKNKTLTSIVILGIFVVAAFFLYSYSSESSGSATTEGVIEVDTTQPFLAALSTLNTIQLDGSIFNDPVFISLTDFGVVIPLQPVGRRNPFLPIGTAPTTPGQ